jgi:hypothetical protein
LFKLTIIVGPSVSDGQRVSQKRPTVKIVQVDREDHAS